MKGFIEFKGMIVIMLMFFLGIGYFAFERVLQPSIPNNDASLDILWVTWSDDGSHVSYYYAYSSGNRPDSVLHIYGPGSLQFKKPAGDTYDCFEVPPQIDSIIHYETFGEAINPYRFVPCSLDFSREDPIYEEINTRWGQDRRRAGYRFTGWHNVECAEE
jgi:hypothetical protein